MTTYSDQAAGQRALAARARELAASPENRSVRRSLRATAKHAEAAGRLLDRIAAAGDERSRRRLIDALLRHEAAIVVASNRHIGGV